MIVLPDHEQPLTLMVSLAELSSKEYNPLILSFSFGCSLLIIPEQLVINSVIVTVIV